MSKYEGWHGLVRESEHSRESLRWRDLKRAGGMVKMGLTREWGERL